MPQFSISFLLICVLFTRILTALQYELAGTRIETVFDLFDYDEGRDPTAESRGCAYKRLSGACCLEARKFAYLCQLSRKILCQIIRKVTNLEFQNGDARSDLSASPIKTPAALL
jgi:hypothetical protein